MTYEIPNFPKIFNVSIVSHLAIGYDLFFEKWLQDSYMTMSHNIWVIRIILANLKEILYPENVAHETNALYW